MSNKKPTHIFSKLTKYNFVIYFFALAILILGRLLRGGYILTFDMVFAPGMHPAKEPGLFTIHEYLISFFAQIIPADILQKIILLIIFTTIGSGMFLLSKKLFKNTFVGLISGTIYLLNPFVYERFLAGNWQFLVGYAMLPIFIYFLIDFYYKDYSNKIFLIILAIWGFASVMSQHHFLLFGVVFASATFLKLVKEIYIKKELHKLSKTAVFSLFISLLFIAALYIYSKNLEFAENQLLFFAASTNRDFGVVENLLYLSGFWAQPSLFDHFFENSILLKLLWTAFLLCAIMGAGFVMFKNLIPFFRKVNKNIFDGFPKLKLNKEYNSILILILLIGILGYGLSLGLNGTVGKIYSFFFTDIPLLRGMREPQKFLSLFALSYSILIGFFFVSLKNFFVMIEKEFKFKEKNRIILNRSLGILILIIFLAGGIPLLNAANSQLSITTYPDSFIEFNEILENSDDPKILILPWNAYFDFNWNERRIVDPSPIYFDAEVISQNPKDIIGMEKICDIEFTTEIRIENSPNYQACFNYSDDPELFIKTFKLLEFDYILLHNSFNAPSAEQLLDMNHLEQIIDSKEIRVYRVK
ncbi:MAG TPA: hypothetical protein VGA67_03355 [Candidatus Dojkabacteria bacterium]|jgi:hypothetical protein